MTQSAMARFGAIVGGRCKNAAATVIDFIYPPACPGCQVLLGRHAGVCAACWSSLRFIERPYCEVLGAPFSHDLGPGILCADAIADPPPFSWLRTAVAHDGLARTLVHSLKYRDRTDLAPMMAGWMVRAADGLVGTCDVIVPVPLHRYRLLARKFNQAAELARAIARLTGKPLLVGALRRTRPTKRQVGLGIRARQENVQGAFSVTEAGKAALLGKRVLLIDDVYTTGATVAAATRTLRRNGAAEVGVLTFARALADHI
ncbi:ComF family protein [Mycoplana dimorpha]|uniref:ComF family protein n=2 Tax=Mycoplana dimorpha TaxID=28320 RepID=A0A2T5BC93_MYCDI|nr:ComF family protein [Mycoplana dimorpha]